MKLALALLLSFSFGVSAHAAAPRMTTKISKPSPKWLETSGDLSYRLLTDFSEQTDPRSYRHVLAAGVSLDFKDSLNSKSLFTVNLGASGLWQSVGSSVDANHNVLQFGDVDASIEHASLLGEAMGAKHAWRNSLGINVPTSSDSQFEGIKAIPYFSSDILSRFGQRGMFSVRNAVSALYAANTFKYSPVSNRINSDLSLAYALAFSARLFDRLTFTATGSLKNTHYLDNTNTVSFSNTQSLNLALTRALRAGVSYTNGSHTLDRDVSLWHIDRYRRVVAFTMGYGF